MSGRIKKLAEMEVIIALASALFGILIGPLLEKMLSPLFDTPTSALLVGLLFLSLLTLISTIAIGIFAKRQDNTTTRINNALDSISHRLGLSVKFEYDPPKYSEGDLYRSALRIIEQAENEILVLHHTRPIEQFSEHSGQIETEEYRQGRETYTQAILNKVQQNKTKRLFYRRIFQFPEGRDARITEERIGKRWLEHIKGVLAIFKEYPDLGYIKKSSLFLDQTFIVVDRRHVIWAIDGIEPESGVGQMEGALFFEDPHQEFIQYLVGFFERVDARAVIVQEVPEE